MDIQILKVLSAFALMQIVIWLIFLFNVKKGDREQRIFLVKMTFLFSIFVVGISLLVFGQNSNTYFIANLSNLILFLPLPLLYGYAQKNKLDGSKLFLHFLPFVVIAVSAVIILLFTSVHESYFHQYSSVLISLFCLQALFYALLFKRKRSMQDGERNSAQGDVWFRPFIIGFSVIVFLNISIYTSWNIFSHYGLCIFLCSLFFISSFIAINILILYALLKKEHLIAQVKYANSKLTNNEIESEFLKIENELILNGMYKNPLVSLTALSKKILLPQAKISQILNEKSGQNFNEFINEHRIKDAQQLIINCHGSMKIIDIAYEVGYNSKSTFNTAFKKFTGKTPSEFRSENT